MRDEFQKLKDEMPDDSITKNGVENSQGGKVFPLKKRIDCTPEELEYCEKVWAKRKGSGSERRKIASQINGLKLMKNPDEIKQRALKLINNPDANVIQILTLQEELLQSEELTDKDKIGLLKTLTEVRKVIFPKTQSTNLNVTGAFSEQLNQFFQAREKLLSEDRLRRLESEIKIEDENEEAVLPEPMLEPIPTESPNSENNVQIVKLEEEKEMEERLKKINEQNSSSKYHVKRA